MTRGTRARCLVLVCIAAIAPLPLTADESDAETPSTASEEAAPGDGIKVEARAATLVEALQGKDGVRIQTLCTHCNSANIQVGGLSAELVPMSRDGFPLVGGLQTSFVLSFLPTDSIAEATVVKGPGAAALSNTAAGGEIALAGSTADEVPWLDFVGEVGSWDLRRATARIAGDLAPWISGSFVVGTTETDLVDDDEDGWTDVPAVDRQFAEGILELEPTSNQSVEVGVSFIDEENLEGRGAFDAFRYITQGEDSWTREDTLFDRREYRAGWSWRPESGGELSIRLLDAERNQTVRSQLTALEDGFFEDADRLIDRFEITEDDRWVGISYRRTLGLQWRIEGGVETDRREIDAINREPLDIIAGGDVLTELATESVDVDSISFDAGWAPSQKWDVQFGLRWDEATMTTELSNPEPTFTRRTDSEVSPRLTVRYFPARDWTLRLVAGKTFRPPKPILSQVCCGQRYQTVENVIPEVATTVGLETSWVPSPRLRANVYLARTEFEDYIFRVVGWSTAFIQTWALSNVPDATADRAEVSLRWSPDPRLTLDGSIGWLSFKNDGDEKVDVIVSPPSRSSTETVPISIDRIPYLAVRSGTASATWRLASGTILGAQASYTGEMSIQQYTRLPFNSELDTETLRDTPGFWLVNLNANLPLGSRVHLLLAIDNLSDELQNDLGDPTTDYNWGPLAGRSWRIGVRVGLDR